MNNLTNCPSCEARVGQLHRLGCDIELCPYCGGRLLYCVHSNVYRSDQPVHEERLAWIGEWPGARECREFGWWAKPDPAGPGYVPCGPDDPEARPDRLRL